MAKKKQLVTAYLTPEQMSGLREISRITRVPLSHYVREGIDLILAKNGGDDEKQGGNELLGGDDGSGDGDGVLLPCAELDLF